MYQRILVPIDIAEADQGKRAIDAAVMMAQLSSGSIRLVNVLPMTPVMLAEYVPPDFDMQQRTAAEEALAALARSIDLGPGKVMTTVRQGGVYHEILDEAKEMNADLIVMSSHRTGVRTYFLGSHAGHVVRYAECSVLGVRGQPH
jgi:nucleotide-binding universal stress UspA family protein